MKTKRIKALLLACSLTFGCVLPAPDAAAKESATEILQKYMSYAAGTTGGAGINNASDHDYTRWS